MINLELTNQEALFLLRFISSQSVVDSIAEKLASTIENRLNAYDEKPLFAEYTPVSELPPMDDVEIAMINETPTPRVIQAIKSYRNRFPGMTLKQAKYKSDTYR